jgi:Thioredoxin
MMPSTLNHPRTTYGYHEFVALCESLLAENKATGTNHSQAYLDYSRINLQRMHRIYKTTQVIPALSQALSGLRGSYEWLVLVEGWCGDVGQNLPVIAKAVENHPNIRLVTILRDENLDLMDQYLTHGGRAIPKMIVSDQATGEVLAVWGPRPAPAQQRVMDYKQMADRPPYAEFVKTVQRWYAGDRSRTLQAELLALVEGLE